MVFHLVGQAKIHVRFREIRSELHDRLIFTFHGSEVSYALRMLRSREVPLNRRFDICTLGSLCEYIRWRKSCGHC
jgi:hypothetical protein